MERDNSELIKELGIFGLKTLITLNSGSVVVLLAFIGRNFGSKDQITVDISEVKISMLWFLAGICSSLFSLFITYILAQFQQDGKQPRPSIFLTLMLTPAAFAFLFFTIGFYLAVQSLS